MKTQIDTTKYTAHLHPGKFEGESAATEYFYEQGLNGAGEQVYSSNTDDDTPEEYFAETFQIDAKEAEAFDLPIGATFMILEDSQGFVYGSVHANREDAEKKFRGWLGL